MKRARRSPRVCVESSSRQRTTSFPLCLPRPPDRLAARYAVNASDTTRTTRGGARKTREGCGAPSPHTRRDTKQLSSLCGTVVSEVEASRVPSHHTPSTLHFPPAPLQPTNTPKPLPQRKKNHRRDCAAWVAKRRENRRRARLMTRGDGDAAAGPLLAGSGLTSPTSAGSSMRGEGDAERARERDTRPDRPQPPTPPPPPPPVET